MMSRAFVACCAARLLALDLARGRVVELVSFEFGAGAYDAAACNGSIVDTEGRRTLKLHERLLVGVPEKLPAGGEAELLWASAACVAAAVRQIFVHLDASCFRVFCWGMLTCVTTGLGALPFALVGKDAFGERGLALANAAASGMMLSASAGMLQEAHAHSGPWAWQLLAGLAAGAAFIRGSERLNPGHGVGDGEQEEDDVVLLHSDLMDKRHSRKAWLIFIVMFCHSAAEGVAVGVAFSRQLHANFGLFVSLLLAVHNIPEGLAVSLVLVPRGVSIRRASAIAMLTSLPQPLMAVVAYLFVDAFHWLLPVGLAFAAGAMAYVCFHELLTEAAEHLGTRGAVLWTSASFAFMSAVIAVLHSLTGDALWAAETACLK